MGLDLHFCRADEIGDVMAFLGAHWASGHVLARPTASSLLEIPRLDTNHLPKDRDAEAAAWTSKAG